MIRSILEGLRRGLRSPAAILLVWSLNLVVALPSALALHFSLRDAAQGRPAERQLLEGAPMDWLGFFREDARGVATTFQPTLIRGGGFFKNADDMLDGSLFGAFPGMLVSGIGFGVLWLMVMGALIPRFADVEDPADKRRGFFARGARYLPRFLRLTLMGLPFYALVFWLAGWLRGRIEAATGDTTAELAVLWPTLGVVLLTALLLAVVHLSLRFARIATVVESRKSMLFALLRGLGFVITHPHRIAPLFALFVALQALVVVIYHQAGPGVAQQTAMSIALAFAASQVVLLLRAGLTVSRLAAETHLFVDANRSAASAAAQPVDADAAD